MSIIGRLRVILGADASQLESTLAQTRQQFRAISAAFAATAAAAGTAMLAVSREVIAGASEIKNLSQVANAVPEEFQKWSAATSTVGIEQDKLADILKDVNDRVGDFLSTGGGPMADFFDNIAPKVGVTAEQFRHLSGPQALQLYVDSLEKAGVSQGEMTFYLEAMASDLTMMLPLLRNGGAEMARLGSRAEEFGAVLSGPTLVAMRRTQVALAEVGLVFKGMAYQLATAMQPSIEAMANAFTALAEKGQPINTAFTLLIDNLGRLATYGATAAAMVGTRLAYSFVAARIATLSFKTALDLLKGALIRTGIGALIVVAGELVYRFGELVRGAGGFGEALGLLKNAAIEVWQRIGDGADFVAQSVRAMSNKMNAWFIEKLGTMTAKFIEFTWTVAEGLNAIFGTTLRGADGLITQKLQLAYVAANEAAAAAEKSAAAAASRFSAPLVHLEALRTAMKGVATETQVATDAAGDLNETLAGSGAGGDEGGKGRSPAKDAKEEMTELEKRAQSAADTIRSSFTDAFKGIVSGAQTFGQAVGSILQGLADMMLQGLGNAIFGGISKSLGGIFAGAFPAYANGTPNHPGGLAWVGERGRELVNLPRGSSVIPNNKLGGPDRGPGGFGTVQVQIVPSPYFDARVGGISQQVAGPMVQAGMQASAQQFGNIANSFNERGTAG